MKTKKFKRKHKLFGDRHFSPSQKLEIVKYRILIIAWLHDPKYDGDTWDYIVKLKPEFLNDEEALKFAMAVNEADNHPGSTELLGTTFFYKNEYC
jgi:hypothetical protein